MTAERVMLLIDADNVSVDVMEQAVRLLMNQHGAVHVRRAYCTAESAVKHQAVFKRLSIKPMVNLSAGKNSTDIALAVDAVDLVLAERPDVVVIASSDSDFAPLVARLREKGCVVRGIGQEGKTGDETQDAYDDFTVLAHRKALGAGSPRPASGAAAPGRRGSASGGGRSAGGGRTAAASQKPPAAQPGKAGQDGKGGARGGRAERSGRAGRPAPAETPSAADLAEDDAAAEATLAALRAATQRAAEQQAAAAAAQAVAAEQRADAGAETGEDTGTDTGDDTVPLPSAPAAKKAARQTPARKTAARKSAAAEVGDEPKPTRKTAARKTAARKATARQAAPVEAGEAALPVAEAEVLAAQIAATLAPPAAPPAVPPRAAQPAPPPREARPAAPSAAVAALPDKVLEILASLPELARGDTVELRLASQRMRDAGLLGKSASSAKLLGQFADRFELLPPGQPNHVRLRGGKLV